MRLEYIRSYCIGEHAESKTNAGFEAAAAFLYVRLGNVQTIRRQWQEAQGFVIEFERLYGRDLFVRIAGSLLGECREGKLAHRQFCILCAINSQIGSKKYPVRITQPSIRVRAAGYRSWRVFEAAVPAERRESTLLASHKVRYTVESLHRRGLFQCSRSGPRTVLFMIGVTGDELREMVVKEASRRIKFAQDCRSKDAEMRQRIKGIKAINDVKRAINGDNPASKIQSTVPPRSDDTGHANSHDINNSVANSSIFNSSISSNSVPNSNVVKPGALSKRETEEKGYLIDDVLYLNKRRID